MNALNFTRLSIMMFLQFFIWGAWYVTGPSYLTSIGFDGADFGWMYSVGPIAAIISPLFLGMIADRFFPTERVLGVMHLLGGGAMFGAVALMKSANPSPDMINILFFVYMLTYMPTLGLTNTLAMHTMTDSEKQFPLIRVFGTLGWIVAGILLGVMGWGASIEMFHIAAGAALFMGIYSFTLPHTPPPMAGKKARVGEILGLDAAVLLKRRSYLAFIISSFLICIPLAFYYQMAARTVQQGGVENVSFELPLGLQIQGESVFRLSTPIAMTFGQASEVIFMVLMPLFFVRLGVKWMLFVGMLAWVVRYALFAVGAPDGVVWMLLAGVILHGICYDFFFVTGQIYTDKAAPPQIRAQAQGLLVLFTLGIGMLIGAQVGGRVEGHFTPQRSRDFAAQATALDAQIKSLTEQGGSEQQVADLTSQQQQLTLQSMQAIEWRSIWTVPAIIAGVIMVIFALVFRDDSEQDGKSDGAVAADLA